MRLLLVLLVDNLAAAQATRYHCGLKLRPFSWRMGGKVASNRNQDVTPHPLAPLPVLLDTGLQHLKGMEFGVLAQHRATKRGDQRLLRMTKDEITGNQAPGHLYGPLAIEPRKKVIA